LNTKINKFGLSRTIPLAIKRQIRQQCNFGCVVCGNAIIEYEHVEPEYHESEEHNPKKMTLLCPQCHAKVTRGLLSKETIKKAMQSPKCCETGYSREILDISTEYPKILYGKNGMYATNCSIPIQINNTPLIKIEKPDSFGEPYKLSCLFYDSSNRKSLEIIDNEFYIFNSNWDVTVEGKSIVIREGLRKIHLKLTFSSPEIVYIEKLNMNYFGHFFEVDDSGFKMDGNQLNISIDGCNIGIQLNLKLKHTELSKVCAYWLDINRKDNKTS